MKRALRASARRDGAQVDPFRLAGEAALQHGRQRRRLIPNEIAAPVPGEIALGERDQQRVRARVSQ